MTRLGGREIDFKNYIMHSGLKKKKFSAKRARKFKDVSKNWRQKFEKYFYNVVIMTLINMTATADLSSPRVGASGQS